MNKGRRALEIKASYYKRIRTALHQSREDYDERIFEVKALFEECEKELFQLRRKNRSKNDNK